MKKLLYLGLILGSLLASACNRSHWEAFKALGRDGGTFISTIDNMDSYYIHWAKSRDYIKNYDEYIASILKRSKKKIELDRGLVIDLPEHFTLVEGESRHDNIGVLGGDRNVHLYDMKEKVGFSLYINYWKSQSSIDDIIKTFHKRWDAKKISEKECYFYRKGDKWGYNIKQIGKHVFVFYKYYDFPDAEGLELIHLYQELIKNW